MTRPTTDELERREAAGRAETVEKDERVRYRAIVDVIGSLAEVDVILITPGGVEDVHDRFMAKGDPNGDPKKTLAQALLAARDRVAGFHNPSIVG